MNVVVRERQAEAAEKLMVVDCDIHPNPRTPNDVKQFLPKRWQEHMTTFGSLSREMYSDTIGYPRMSPAISRTDSWPPSGGPPGSDLDFMREQHLDPNGVEIGNLIPLATRGPDQRNLDYGAALCTALNDWQLEYWLNKEPRLRGSMLVPHEDPPAAVAEIERRASDDKFVQVLLPPRTDEPLGRRRYWPIFAAAVAAKRPIAHPRRRPGRACADQQRLALLLHGGAPLQRADHADPGDEPGGGGCVRALPRPARRADRERLCLGAGRCAGAWTASGSASARRCRT